MAWVATAVIGSAVIGGIVSADSSRSASNAANNATQASSQASAEQLAFAKEQQARWDEVFGPTQDVLAEYYNRLDPNDIAATNVSNMQRAYQDTQVQLDKQLAQRGMDNSGLSASMNQNLMYQNNMGKAEARVLAPQQVAQQQASFLGLGMNAQSAVQSGISSAYSNQISAANNSYNAAISQQNQANASFASSIGALGQGIGMYNSSIPSTQGFYDTQAGFIGPSRGY